MHRIMADVGGDIWPRPEPPEKYLLDAWKVARSIIKRMENEGVHTVIFIKTPCGENVYPTFDI